MKEYEMRRKDKQVTDPKWMEAILKRGQVINLGLAGEDGWPYVVPMCYGYRDGAIFLHGAPVGRKHDVLAANSRVCFQVTLDAQVASNELAAKFTMKYRSVMGFGRLHTLTEPEERREALDILMEHYGGPHVRLEDVNSRVWVARIDVESISGKSSVYPPESAESP